MDQVTIVKISSVLIFFAPASFLLYCFLHENPTTDFMKLLKLVTIIFSIISILLGFNLLMD